MSLHLDSLGTIAGLDAPTQCPDAGRQGTDDIQTGFGLSGVRDYKEDWANSSDNDDSPDNNAESYAAAATNMLFMTLSRGSRNF